MQERADAVFFQPPQAERPDLFLAHVRRVADAAKRSSVERLVLNSSMWSLDGACGQPMHHLVHAVENIFAAFCVPLVIPRPIVFMNNWLTAFGKPALAREHKYRYPHKPVLRYRPISLSTTWRNSWVLHCLMIHGRASVCVSQARRR